MASHTRVASQFVAQPPDVVVPFLSSPEVEGVSGQYFANSGPRPSNKESYDVAAATRLWEVSAALGGLSASVK